MEEDIQSSTVAALQITRECLLRIQRRLQPFLDLYSAHQRNIKTQQQQQQQPSPIIIKIAKEKVDSDIDQEYISDYDTTTQSKGVSKSVVGTFVSSLGCEAEERALLQAAIAISIATLRVMGARLQGKDSGRLPDDPLRQELNRIRSFLKIAREAYNGRKKQQQQLQQQQPRQNNAKVAVTKHTSSNYNDDDARTRKSTSAALEKVRSKRRDVVSVVPEHEAHTPSMSTENPQTLHVAKRSRTAPHK